MSPLAKRLAGEADFPLDGIQGTGPNARIIAADVKEALAQPRAAPAAPVAEAAPVKEAPKAAPASGAPSLDLPPSAFEDFENS